LPRLQCGKALTVGCGAAIVVFVVAAVANVVVDVVVFHVGMALSLQ
jgi:hypothetical protein